MRKEDLAQRERLLQRVEETYTKYGVVLTREAMKRYHFNQSVAEDVVHIVFERVMMYAPDFGDLDDDRAFRFLYSIMKNESCRILAKQKDQLTYDELNKLVDFVPPQALLVKQDPELFYMETTLIREALKQLPDECASIIYLHYFYGYPFKEIGKMLGIKENTAIQRCHHTRKKLKNILMKEGFYGKKES